MFYTYLLQSKKDGKWYTGCTNNIQKRLKEHNEGKVWSTKGKGPFEVIYHEACCNAKDAYAREKYLKSGPGKRYLKNRMRRFLSLTGFTIVEILVVIAITTLLTSIIITYTGTGRNQVTLSIEEAKIAQNIQQAKSFAVATYNRPSVPCGYGFFVDYTGRMYGVYGYNAPDCDNIQNIDPAFVEPTEEFELPSALVLGEGEPDSLEYILFIPPDPKTFLWREGESATSTDGRIFLKTRDGNASAEVGVNAAGQVTF